MKIYKKILNFGYGVCCLLPIIYLLFGYLYIMITAQNATFDIKNTNEFIVFGSNFQWFVKGHIDTFISSVEWFKPFETFNNWLSGTYWGADNFIMAIDDTECISVVFVILYSEWVVLVSFFRLFGSVFGCMINFADKMLDKIGGTN